MKKKLFFLLTLTVLFVAGVKAQSTCLQPSNFTATLHQPSWQNVQLNWSAPEVDVPEIKWCSAFTTGIGMNAAADFTGAVRFGSAQLAPHHGESMTVVSFVPYEAATTCTYHILVWQGGSQVDDTTFDAGTLLFSQQVEDSIIVQQQFVDVVLNTPVVIDSTQELWIGVRCVTTAGYPLGSSNNGGVFNYGDLIYADEDGVYVWETLSGGNPSSSLAAYNWCITGKFVDFSLPALTGYNLSRDDTPILSATTLTSYLDSLDFGTYEYELTAIYDNGCESDPVSVTVNMIPNPCLSCSDTVQVGNGTTGTYYVPVNTFYNYSFSEQIYTAQELGTINGTISCIAYQYFYSSAQNKDIIIYMGNTNKNSFSGSSDWISVNNMYKVFEGTVNFNNSGDGNWVSIPLDIPFEYDGSSNIVVAVLNNTGTYVTSSNSTFYVHSASSKTLYVQQDGSPYNVNALPSGTTYSSRNNIRFFIGDPVACPMPSQLTVSEITTESAVVTWSGSEEQSGFEYVVVPQGNAPESGDPVFISDTTVQLTDLADGTSFTVYVRSNCGSDNSSWVSFDFKTLCLPLTDLPYEMHFDGMGSGTGVIPDCWTADVAGGYSGYPYISTSYHHTGNGSLYFYSYSATNAVIRGQGLDLTDHTGPLVMKYYAYKTSASYGYLQAGYMTDPTDFNTFVCVKTIYSSDFNVSTWHEVTFPLPESVNGQVIYPVLYCPAAPGSTSNYIYVDDVTIYEVDGICMAPTEISVSNISGTSALISWTPNSFATSDELYTVQYSETGADQWQTLTTTSTHVSISGLELLTPYTVRLFVDCGDELYSDTLTATFSTHCLAGGELAIGDGSSYTGYLPEYSFYKYSYTQQIFLASEMNGATPITSVAFNAYSIADASRHLSIYLMHTTESNLSNYVTPTNAEMVYNGTPTLVAGWNTFEFTTPFMYNGTDNLLLIVIDSTGSYTSSNQWYYHVANGTLARYNYQDSAPYSITAPPSGGTATSNRNNVIFGGECDSTATCIAPSLLVEDFTNESVTLSWTPGYQETTWEMEYSETGTEDWNAVSATNSPVVVDNLEPNTSYTFRIRSACGGSEYSSWVTATVSTVCDYIDVPYSQDFEADSVSGAGTMTTCWISGTNYSTAYPYISTSYAQSGSRSLYFYGTSSYYSYAALPRFADDVAMDSLVVNFSLLSTSSNYSIEMGIMTDAYDFSTFVPLGMFSPGIEGVWKSFEVNTNSYSGNGHYLAFRIPQWGTSYMYLDDVTVDYIMPCAHPTALTVESVTASEATLSWTAGGDETEWEYTYGPVESFDLEDAYSELTTDNTVTVSGLDDNTVYHFYVRSVCSASEISAWEHINFRTECLAFTELPYTQNFDSMVTTTSNTTSGPNNLTDCWEGISTGSTYTSYPFVYYGSSYSNSGNYSLRFYSYYSGDYGDQYAILPPIDVDVLSWSNLMLEFNMKNGTTTSPFTLVVGVIEGNDISTFVPVDTISQVSTSFVQQSVAFNNYEGSGNRIAIVNKQPGSDYSYGQIDDILLTAPTCIHPNDLEAIDADTNSVTLSWNERGEATSWNIEYGPVGFTPGTGTVIQVSTNPYTVTGLANSTSYDFYVQSLCSASDASVWSIKTTANTTMVPTSLPYATDFSDPNDAWILNNGSCTNYWVRGNVNGGSALFVTQDGTTAGYSVSDNSMVSAEKLFTVGTDATVTVQFDVTVGGESMYDFLKLFVAPPTMEFPSSNSSITSSDYGYYSYTNYAYDFYTNGYGTQSSYPYVMNLTSGNTVHVIAEMPNPNSNPNANSTAKVVFVWRNDLSAGTQPGAIVTNVQIGEISCPFPTDLNASNITMTSADISWTPGGNETAWILEYKESDASTWTTVPLTTPSYSLSNLTAATLYDVRVQADCGGGDQSIFTSISFGTTLCSLSDQCTYTFNLTDSYGDGWNGGYIDVQQNGISVTSVGLSSGSSATETVLLCDGLQTSLVWHSGSYDSEVSFTVDGPDGTEVYSASSVSSGTLTTFTTDCGGSGPVITDPTVATTAATSITQTGATLNGTITNPDNVAITAKGFEWKATSGGTYAPVTVTGNNLTYNLTGLTANTGYTYKAFITFNGTTVYGSEMTFTTLPEDAPEPCDVPTNLHTTDIQNESISITWNANANVNSWNVQYRPAAGGQWTQVTVNTNSYTITNLTGKTNYEIQVQANCGDGNLSDWSASITVQTTDVGIVSYLENSITLFPNPANDVINVQSTMFKVQSIEVIDVYGKLINTVNVVDNPTRINVSGLANGMYFVRVTTEEGVVTKNFIKR